MKLRRLLLGKKVNDQPRQHIKKQRHYFTDKGPSSQSYVFPSSHVWMWELDHKESWKLNNWSLWTVVLEKTLESPLDCKEIKLVNPKGNQSWIFIRRTNAKLKLQYFGHLIQRTDSLDKTLMLGKIEGRKRRGRQEDEMAGWHHWFDGHESDQVPGVGNGPGSLVCCSPRGHEVSDTTTEQLNWTEYRLDTETRQTDYKTNKKQKSKHLSWRESQKSLRKY